MKEFVTLRVKAIQDLLLKPAFLLIKGLLYLSVLRELSFSGRLLKKL